MRRILSILFFLFLANRSLFSQFAPAVDEEGSDAISKDSMAVVEWAITCSVQRGYIDISDKSLGYVSYGAYESGIGKADGIDVVSLGDSGIAILSFQNPVTNHEGPDIAVFENSFNNTFLELAFVEVSYDSIQYYRFPPVSNSLVAEQISSFGEIDATCIYNLAGKYKANYGTPFDLEELKDTLGIYIDSIRFVKIIDVTGCIDDEYAQYDSKGNKVNDPWPTAFESGGFDLDAVAIVNCEQDLNSNPVDINTFGEIFVQAFPNPIEDYLTIRLQEAANVSIYTLDGKKIMKTYFTKGNNTINSSAFFRGIYLIKIETQDKIYIKKIIK
ncbi:MAG: T9SS type A sorting domain-containing protein [Bacteroidales bacterium]|nr:T9SS type A sorting domain-containing protein [Bacteroidales bacterium]